MSRNIIFWIFAFIFTLAAASYQRITGPTYPMSGKQMIAGEEIRFSFDRSHGGLDNHVVAVRTDDSTIAGMVQWRRHNTPDQWVLGEMRYEDGTLTGELPHQPPAGKLDYMVTLRRGNEFRTLPGSDPVVIRFKGDVPMVVLIPHILIIFAAMLFSTRTGLEFFHTTTSLRKLTFWTLGLLIVGGMILGPIVQYYAFGAFWTGYPFGSDLTDNKTLVALIGWVGAAVSLYKSKRPAVWALVAAVLLLIVYLIPHSLLGSELDYSQQPTP